MTRQLILRELETHSPHALIMKTEQLTVSEPKRRHMIGHKESYLGRQNEHESEKAQHLCAKQIYPRGKEETAQLKDYKNGKLHGTVLEVALVKSILIQMSKLY